MKDLFGNALFDLYENPDQVELLLHNEFSEPDILDLEGYFFTAENFTELELYALDLCRGKTLDIGSAAGRHVLELQKRGFEVTGLDKSKKCQELMELRGVAHLIKNDIFDCDELTYDTWIMLMNGIGLVRDLKGLKFFLSFARNKIRDGGQLIFDSSSIDYLKEQFGYDPKGYIGELNYQYEYRGQFGSWFKWLYVDQLTLRKIANECGWFCQIVFENMQGQYLAVLRKLDNKM